MPSSPAIYYRVMDTPNPREQVEALLADDNPDAIYFDGLDDCIDGIARQFSKPSLVVYDYDRLVLHFINEGLTEEEAEEHIGFNIEGLWAGEHTPLIIRSIESIQMDY